MFNLLIMISAIAVVSKCAELEGRSGFAWGGITLLICICCSVIPFPLINMVVGFVMSFILLFTVKVISGRGN